MAFWAGGYGNYHNDRDGSKTPNLNLNTHRYTRNDIRVAENELSPTDPNTNSKVMLSTNVFIYANTKIVGMIQSFTVNEQRTINKLQAIGWEGVVQSVPSNTRGGSLNVNRIALYDSTLYNSLGLNSNAVPQNTLGSKVHTPTQSEAQTGDQWDTHYTMDQSLDGDLVSTGLSFRTLKDQRAPLEIQVKTPLNGNGGDNGMEYYTVTYIDAWISSYSKPYSTNQIYVAETATIVRLV